MYLDSSEFIDDGSMEGVVSPNTEFPSASPSRTSQSSWAMGKEAEAILKVSAVV